MRDVVSQPSLDIEESYFSKNVWFFCENNLIINLSFYYMKLYPPSIPLIEGSRSKTFALLYPYFLPCSHILWQCISFRQLGSPLWLEDRRDRLPVSTPPPRAAWGWRCRCQASVSCGCGGYRSWPLEGSERRRFRTSGSGRGHQLARKWRHPHERCWNLV